MTIAIIVYVILVGLVFAFFAGAHRLNGDDLTEAEAQRIADLTDTESYIRIPGHDAQPERGSATVKELDAPATGGRGA